ncbi:MAG: T9SS type A sorting domain-containing protein, partial [Bacteroidota bacterium]
LLRTGLNTISEAVAPAGEAGMLQVFPNPVTAELNVRFEALKGGSGALRVYGMDGRLLSAQRMSVRKGANEMVVEMEKLPAGMYVVELQTKDFVLRRRVARASR